MTESEQGGTAGRQFSMSRLMVTILIVILCALVAYQYGLRQVPQLDSTRTKRIFGLDERRPRELAAGLVDADSDLVADAPAQPNAWVDPEAILFSYVATTEAADMAQAWQPLVDQLKQATGKPVQYIRFESAPDQLKAIREGRLHVTAVNTGNVPEAVASCGFIPVATPAKSEGNQGYTMKIIVPADSTILKPEDLAGQQIAFTTAGSNSGCKAPMEVLMRLFNLEPDADYRIVFSRGHEQSIKGIASKQYQAAAIASDLLELAIANGEIKDSDFRTVYTSEQFPSVAIGYVYNLNPELAEKVRSALIDFKPQGTSAAEQLSEDVTGFAPVSYKDDWALVRRIDEYRPAESGETPANGGS
jgi:phosphonate transport system substrate-binding protein